MKIYIFGGTSNTKKLVRSITEFCGKKLLGNRLADNITIKIRLSNSLRKDSGLLGWCTPNTLRDFEVAADTAQSIEKILKTIAHEMTHIKQFAKRELTNFQRTPKWHGEEVNDSTVDYYDLPWEIEAHGREEGLYNCWLDTKNLRKKDVKK